MNSLFDGFRWIGLIDTTDIWSIGRLVKERRTVKPCEGYTVEDVVDHEEDNSWNGEPVINVNQDKGIGTNAKKCIYKEEWSEPEEEFNTKLHTVDATI